MRYIFFVTYILVLLTQLPHIWAAYAALEQDTFGLAHITALGAAIAFELATGVFTLRIVQGSKRRWTRLGLGFFIVASAVANAFYYRWWPSLFDWLMPIFATIALPLALALFAEEFGTELKAAEREAKREQRKAEREERRQETGPPPSFVCSYPGCNESFPSQQALAGHANAHRNGREREPTPIGAQAHD